MPEPISLETAKAQCRILDTSEDALLTGYIKAAREWVENYTGHILVQRQITEHRESFGRHLEVFTRPVVSVDSIGYTGSDGAPATVAAFISTARNPVRIYPESSWPTLGRNGEVTITYTAGYSPGAEPQALIQAMLLLICHWFVNREGVITGTITAQVAFAVMALCDQHRTPVV